MMYANECLNKGKLVIALTQVVTRDLFKEITSKKVPATHFRGKNHVDGIWATEYIDYHAEIFLPLW